MFGASRNECLWFIFLVHQLRNLARSSMGIERPSSCVCLRLPVATTAKNGEYLTTDSYLDHRCKWANLHEHSRWKFLRAHVTERLWYGPDTIRLRKAVPGQTNTSTCPANSTSQFLEHLSLNRILRLSSGAGKLLIKKFMWVHTLASLSSWLTQLG